MIGFYRKNKKKVVFFAILFLVAAGGIILYFRNRVPKEIYVEDYPEIYAEELRIIFGEDYEIGEKETFYEEGYICSCGEVMPTVQYDTWEVTYHDWSGETFTQTIDNRDSLESLQYSWLKNHLKQYYEKKYLIDYFDEGTFEELTRKTHCYVYIGVEGGSTADKKEEHDRIEAGNRKYQKQLLAAYGDKDTMLRLSELNYKEIYDHYPIIAGFHLSIDDGELSGEEKEIHERAVQDRILEMIQAIQSEKDDTCNLRVYVTSADGDEDLYDDARSWRYDILQGKQFESEKDPVGSYYFAHAYAYEGIYW
ncbi:MAG: hypothetical protein K2H31_09535 [Lachnospiraceae bacterium]|nr:hypothetical protein [Lachnospiraceae bacterium]